MTTTNICAHIFTDAHRCGSPALRGESFCFYHHPTRQPSLTRRARQGFRLAAPTDARSRKHALHQIIQRLADNRLDVHRASLMLYALQVADSSS